MRGIQCQKSLFYYKNNYKERDAISVEQKERFDRGHRIGILAQQLFPNGIDLTPPNVFAYDQSVKATQLHILRKTPVVYEAAFRALYTTIAIDVLTCNEEKYYAYEVKSNRQIKDVFLLDAAIQYAVISASGLALEDISLITLHPDYNPDGDMKGNTEIFSITSIKNEVLALQSKVLEEIGRAIETLSKPFAPDIQMGEQCHNPYTCDFIGKCSRI